jgi:hypothetical protein
MPPGQVPGDPAHWAEPVRDEWAPRDQGVWIPDGRGGWAHPAQDDWRRAAAAAQYLAGPADRHLAGPADGHVAGAQEEHLAGAREGHPVGPADGHVAGAHEEHLAGAREGHPVGPADGHVAGAHEEHLAGAREGHPAGPADTHLTGPGAADEQDRSADDDDTSPIPVILAADAPGPPSMPPAPAPPPRPAVPAPQPFSVWEPARPRGRRPDEPYQPEHAEPPSADTQEKIEAIKDLYVTAEAIGEDAVVRHFEQLKTRQRSLISEFFEKAGLGPRNATHSSQDAGGDAAGESAPGGASLPR